MTTLAGNPPSQGPTDEEAIRRAIRETIDDRVRAQPDGDINAVVIRQLLNTPSISNERVTAALRRLAGSDMLFEHRREKVPGNESAKDRKIIQYRATDLYKRHLGLIAAPPPVGSAVQMLRSVHLYAQGRGFVCTLADIANYFLCLQAKPFVILSGISGTGKTRLPRLVAEATDAAFRLIPVKSNWTDNSDLMGYYSVTLDRFITGDLLEAVRTAIEDPARPHFVVLDEMNLAHVEHYLSDVLSVMETRRRVASDVVTDPLPVDIPAPTSYVRVGGVDGGGVQNPPDSAAQRGDEAADNDQVEALRELRLPWNLFLIGTVNVDETTHPFSRKVLDRSFAIDYNEVDLTNFGGATAQTNVVAGADALFLNRALTVQEVYGHDPSFFGAIGAELAVVNRELRRADLHFAYRVRDEIALYMWAWRHHQLDDLLLRDDAFDFCLLQKVLPRCQGSSETARRALEGVFHHAAAVIDPTGASAAASPAASTEQPAALAAFDPYSVTEPSSPLRWRYPRTARKALSMLRRFADNGYFAFWS